MCRSWNSDMSKRTIGSSSPNSDLGQRARSSVLPTPVGPEEQEAADGAVRITDPARLRWTASATTRDGLVLADDTLVQGASRSQQALENLGW